MAKPSSPAYDWQQIALESNTQFAGIVRRGLALGVDVLVFLTCFFPVTRLVKRVWLMSPTDHRWANGLFIGDPLCLAFLLLMFL